MIMGWLWYDYDTVMKEYRLLEFNCCILVNMRERILFGSNMESKKSSSRLGEVSLIDILQRLLNYQNPLPSSSSQLKFNVANEKWDTVASGLILAKYVFQTDYCSCKVKELILACIRDILLPPKGHCISPCTCYWGIDDRPY